MFTSNSSLNNYEYYEYGKTYKVNDFIKETYDDINNLFEVRHEHERWDKNSEADKSYFSSINISEDAEMSQDKKFVLDKEILDNMYTMTRSEFIHHYTSTYPYITETYIPQDEYVNGYADLRNENYYVVPTSQFRWDAERNKPYIPKIKEGIRNTMMWMDAVYFMKIVPNITKEHLVYLLTVEVYRNFDNSDKQLTNQFIITKCREV